MKDAVIGYGTCLDTEIDIDVIDDYAVLDVYLQVFNKRDGINFYGVGNKYARSLEFDTPHLDLMAIDAAPVGTSFDPEEYRAGINAIMRHAEIEEKDAVIGGEEFFYNRLGVPWELGNVSQEPFGSNYNPESPATEVFFDERAQPEAIGLPSWVEQNEHEPWVTAKGEDWSDLDEVLIRRL